MAKARASREVRGVRDSRAAGTKGACAFCGRRLTRSGMGRHLQACKARRERLAQAEGSRGRRREWVHLRVADEQAGQRYWLHLEVTSAAPLEELDSYLRAIWLECCGHLSQFVAGHPWRGAEVSNRTRVGDVFGRERELTHVYDFGTSSITKIREIGRRVGRACGGHPIALLARNDLPESPCVACGERSEWLCWECLVEDDRFGFLCEAHVEAHPHQSYGPPAALVNSPRLGMCGYTGPAEPPY